jgi:hypothetical protein
MAARISSIVNGRSDEVLQGHSALTEGDPAWEVPTRESVAREHAALMARYSLEALRQEWLEAT